MCVFGTAALRGTLTVTPSSVLPPGLRASPQLLVPSPSSTAARLALGLYFVVISAFSGLSWFYIEFYFHSHLPVTAKSTNIGNGFFSGC